MVGKQDEIEALIDLYNTFCEHSKDQESNLERLLEKFKEDFPDQPIPLNLINVFNLPKALSVMVREIIKLKHEMK